MDTLEPALEDTTLQTKTPLIAPHSIRRRYAVTLTSQAFQLALSAVTASIVPRALGPVSFGNFSFLMSMSANLRNFTDLSAQQTFFTFSSKEHATGALTRLYGTWLFIQLALSIGLIIGCNLSGTTHLIWPGQYVHHILAVTSLEWLIYVALILRQLGDTKGLTVRTQGVVAVSNVISVMGLISLGWSGRLTLPSYLLFLAVVNLVSSLTLAVYLLKFQAAVCWDTPARVDIKGYLQKWRSFASPLVVYSLYSAFISVLDTYLIQRLYGPTEQAFFSLSLRWSSVVMVFTTSVLAIYWRELTSSLASRDRTRASHIYKRINHLLFFLAAVLGFWLCFNASFLITVFAGPAYGTAIPVLMIMAFYPMQQTCGQLNGAAFMASERTAAYRNLGILLSLPTLVLTYFLLAPRTAPIPGLALGAVGVAIKMVFWGLISVQTYDWLNCRFFNLSYLRALSGKLSSLFFVALCAIPILWGFGTFLRLHWGMSELAGASLTSTLYFSAVLWGVYLKPELAGLVRLDWEPLSRFLKEKIS